MLHDHWDLGNSGSSGYRPLEPKIRPAGRCQQVVYDTLVTTPHWHNNARADADTADSQTHTPKTRLTTDPGHSHCHCDAHTQSQRKHRTTCHAPHTRAAARRERDLAVNKHHSHHDLTCTPLAATRILRSSSLSHKHCSQLVFVTNTVHSSSSSTIRHTPMYRAPVPRTTAKNGAARAARHSC